LASSLKAAPATAVLVTALSLGACGHNPWGQSAALSERECMARAMYFESNRSSPDGMLAVGTVVMNRVQSPRYPKSVCQVVGQRSQFADGVLSKPVSGRSWTLALNAADRVLAGERHDEVGGAMFFHTAGHTFPYRNMAYVASAGGNVFYEKRPPGTFDPVHPSTLVARADPPSISRTAVARAAPRTQVAEAERPVRRPAPVRVAAAAEDDDEDERPAPRHRTSPDRSPTASREPIQLASANAPRRAKHQPSIEELIDADLGQAGPIPGRR
jgi:hypothetical protein